MQRTSAARRPDPAGRPGFSLIEVLIAMTAAVLITAAAASALATVLRNERAQFSLLQDLFRAQGWLAGAAAGVPGVDRPPATERLEIDRKAPWEWAVFRPDPERSTVRAVTRVSRGGGPLQ